MSKTHNPETNRYLWHAYHEPAGMIFSDISVDDEWLDMGEPDSNAVIIEEVKEEI